MKVTAKFRATRRLRFENTKKIMSSEMRPKSFGAFEKLGPAIYGNLRAPVKLTGDNILLKENEITAENDFALIILSSGKQPYSRCG